MLQHNLFTFTDLQTEGDIVKTNIKLNPLHPIFKGHFPDNPILPGVCMMQMVKEVAEAYTNKKIKLVLAQDLKFLSVINPEENTIIQMELKINIEDERISIAAQLLDKATVFFKFKGNFALCPIHII
jgi:3-hydroxyacyl-[acyl-carrier-protein] dehydratase